MTKLSIVNRPDVSGIAVWTYSGLALFIGALILFFVYAGLFTPMGSLGVFAAVALILVEAVILVILASIHRMRYILTEDQVIIKTTRFIGGDRRIPLKAIRSVERTLIPFGLRLFGASFHGGYYHVPGLGRAFMTITNFDHGVLIKTGQGNYIITPKNPESFKETIENKVKVLHVVSE